MEAYLQPEATWRWMVLQHGTLGVSFYVAHGRGIGWGWAMHGEPNHCGMSRKQPLVSRDGQEKQKSEAAQRKGSQQG